MKKDAVLAKIKAEFDPANLFALNQNIPPAQERLRGSRQNLQHCLPGSGLFVVPSMRRRGVGSRLVKACEESAERLGNQVLFLYTQRGRDFYERLGWKLRFKTRYEDDLVSVMARSLRPITDEAPMIG